MHVHVIHCKKKGKVLLLSYLSFLLLFGIVKHSGVILPTLDSTTDQVSRTLVNVTEEYFVNEIVPSCGKGMKLRQPKWVKSMHFSLLCQYTLNILMAKEYKLAVQHRATYHKY